MDTFENNEFSEETEPSAPVQEPVSEDPAAPQEPISAEPAVSQEPHTSQSAPEQNAYRGAGAGRKESPYANSPYVMNHQPQQEGAPRYQPPQYQYQPQTEPPKKVRKERKSHKSLWKNIVAAVLVVAVVAGGCLITAASVNEYWEDRTEDTVERLNSQITDLQRQIDSMNKSAAVSGNTVASGEGMTPGQIYAQCVDSVVAISATSQVTYYGQTAEGTSTGSGFILTADGYVVTNYHVVEDAISVSVITNDSTEYPATVVGYDSGNDIAVLKVEAEGLPAATLGSSSDLAIGDMVVAIGNPLGELTSTQTVGYVSGKDRDVTTDNTIINMIQTDAAINPGNSGGPLFNMYGQVVGVTTAKYSGTTTSGASIEGIGFAIPIDDVKGIISDLMDYGYVTGAYLGVTVQNNNAEAAALYGLPTNGAYVIEVVKGASADRAGIQAKDIIIDLGGYEISTITDLTRALRNFKAGDTTTITVFRSGVEMVLDITLDEKPQDFSSTVTPNDDASMPSEGSYDEWYEWFFGNGNNGG